MKKIIALFAPSYRSISVLINRQLGTWPVLIRLLRSIWSDARHLQIIALASLLTINFAVIDFGARMMASTFALAASLLTQVACSRLTKIPVDLRSPLITGLSLSLLLRAEESWMHAVGGVIAISSKFLLRINGKHVFNPAGLAIVRPAAIFVRSLDLAWPVGHEHLVRGSGRAFSPSWCCTRRAAPTLRSIFS